MNELSSESMNNFIFIYNHLRKYCIDKINEIRFRYKEIDNKLSNNLNYQFPSHLEDEILNDSYFKEDSNLVIY